MSTPSSLGRTPSRSQLEQSPADGAPEATAMPDKGRDAVSPRLFPVTGGLTRPTDGATGIARAWTAVKLNHPLPRENAYSEPVLSPRTSTRDNAAVNSPRTASTRAPRGSVSGAANANTSSGGTLTTTTTTATTATTTTAATAMKPSVRANAAKPVAASSGNRSLDGAMLSPQLAAIVGAGLQSEAVLGPEKLGKLLVAVESSERQMTMGEAKIHDILRCGLKISGYQSPSGQSVDVNVIEQICVPFMRAHLDTPEYAQLLTNMMHQFDPVADVMNALSDNQTPSQYVRNPEAEALMRPVVTPFLDKFCGKERSLASSGMPDAMKRLLLSIDQEIILWFKQSGSGKPADLYDARRNAIVNFLSTRSIMPIWVDMIRQLPDGDRYKKMSAYLNAYIAQKIDDFIADVLIAQPAQSADQRGYVERLAGRRSLKGKASMRKLELPASSVLGKDKSLQSLAGGTSALARSPRARFATVDDAKAAEKQAKLKDMKRKNERAKLIDSIASACGLDKLDFAFYQHLKEVLVNGSARGFDNFKRDPIASCLKRADEWYGLPQNAKIARTSVPDEVRKSLERERQTFAPTLAATFGRMNLAMPSNPFDEAVGQGDDRSSPDANGTDADADISGKRGGQ